MKKIIRIGLTIWLALTLFSVAVLVTAYAWADHQIDQKADDALFSSLGTSQSTRLYTDQRLTDPALALSHEYIPMEYRTVFLSENQTWMSGEEIPQALKDAFVSIEDKRFYHHDGVDWLRTGKAIVYYLLGKEGKFGGSTITQQTVKNVCGENEFSPKRKIKEMVRAIRLEKRYTKDEILTMYLNIVPLSNRCVGVYAASRYYFAKEPMALSIEECASLAAITNSPSKYDPFRQKENHIRRRNLILREMKAQGYITEGEFEEAAKTPLLVTSAPFTPHTQIHDWYTETVLAEVIEDIMAAYHLPYDAAKRMVYQGGLRIMTTMHPTLQGVLDTYFRDASRFYSQNAENRPDYAMVILDAKTGNLLAVAGGVGEKQGNLLQNGATQVRRPPGSALKPLALYLPALEKGLIHYGTVMEDLPQEMGEGQYWPKNTPQIYQGKIPIHESLALSKNTIAVKLYDMLGKETIYSALEKVGIDSLVRKRDGKTDLAPSPLALGQLTDGVTLRDLTQAYTVFCDGSYKAGKSYQKVLDAQGRVLLEHHTPKTKVCSPQNAFIMTKMLEEVTDTGTARHLTLKHMVDVAGKTGTSGGNQDKWFIGSTPDFVAGIRCSSPKGDVDDRAKAPLFVWDDCMKAIYKKKDSEGAPYKKTFPLVGGIVKSAYCRDSGDIPSALCKLDRRGDRIEYGYFTPDNMPKSICHSHVLAYIDPVTEDIYLEQKLFLPLVPIALLEGEKNRVEETIKPLDLPYRLWYHMDKEENMPTPPIFEEERAEPRTKRKFFPWF
ncbi:MAG: transglycosylase domain-containing protein [Clostridia bacterium]|nr:transglycosylase domain-containing protein [Clostridia bacterium]